jgi:hypothetical protein
MRTIGVGPDVPAAELDAYLGLLVGDDGGRAFLRIMRSFERTAAKRWLYESVVGSDRYPVGVLWGSKDPACRCAATASPTSPQRADLTPTARTARSGAVLGAPLPGRCCLIGIPRSVCDTDTGTWSPRVIAARRRATQDTLLHQLYRVAPEPA